MTLFLFLLADLIYIYIILRRYLYFIFMFQLNHYKVQDFFDWFLSNKTRKRVLYPVVLSVLSVILLIFVRFNLILYFEIGLGAVSLPFVNYRQEKKNFKVTSRVKRLFFSSLIVFLITGVLDWLIFGQHHSFNEIVIITLFIVNFLIFDVVIMAHLLVKPVETALQNRFIVQARAKIRLNKSLSVVGITGSYGKTSTKFIVSEVLSKEYNVLTTPESFNTPMGVTMTVNNRLRNITDFFVCEMGARRVGEIKELCDIVSPAIGILTSIGPQHLETFKNIRNIVQTKFELIESLPLNGLAVLNYDNYYIRNYKVNNRVKVLTYGIEQANVDYQALNIRYGTFGSTFEVRFPNRDRHLFKTKLLGVHNIANILSAIALADYLNMDTRKVALAVEMTKPVSHRLELKVMPGYNIIDDSFNANIEGAAGALHILSQFETKKIIITPGMIELGETQYEHNYRFGEQIARVCDFAVLVGKKQTKPIMNALNDIHYPEEQVYVTNSFNEGFRYLAQKFQRGFTVLIENDLPDNYNEN